MTIDPSILSEKGFPHVRYQAAGGIVVRDGQFLLLDIPARGEARLPKGHIEPGESPQETALRETGEESGYAALEIIADLGKQQHSFFNAYKKALVTRDSYFYLMRLTDMAQRPAEEKFVPRWVKLEDAEAALTFEEEREFVRRAIRALAELGDNYRAS
jgi:8-oxo-dGTP pyrophosphatase MutT (NUDIX family)